MRMIRVAKGPTVIIAIAALSLGVLAAGCGGDDETTSSSTTTTTTTGAGNSALCSDLTKLQNQIASIDNIDPTNITVDQLNQKVSSVTSTADQIASDAREAGGVAAADIKSDVNKFTAEVKSASSQDVASALVTLGTALTSLQSSVSKSASDLGC
jgi:ABC-type glycerol-3-phosphate transport system substrate-binding protein